MVSFNDVVFESVKENIIPRIKMVTPVDTGRLRDSIYAEQDAQGIKLIANTNYASFVEYGTSKQQAQPFMRTGIKLGMSDVKKDIGEFFKQELER